MLACQHERGTKRRYLQAMRVQYAGCADALQAYCSRSLARGAFHPPVASPRSGLEAMTDEPKEGRRPRSQRRQRKPFFVYLTDAERVALQERAALASLSASSYARAALIGTVGANAVRRPHPDRQQLALAVAALGKVGSNLNQLAHAANSGRIPSSGEVELAAQTVRHLVGDIAAALRFDYEST